MKIDVSPLMNAIDRYIAKADEDLEETLSAEGYVAAEVAVKAVGEMEEAVTDVLTADADYFLEKIQAATGVDDFVEKVWPGLKDADDLTEALREIFFKKYEELFSQFTFEWMISQNPSRVIPDDGRITKPAEDFIRGWSGELARLMKLSTRDQMERILLKAQENSWTIDQVSDAIAESGIRECGYRSRRVALTEVLRVESYSQQESMIQDPLVYAKKWRHVMSAHPRENHQAIDGQEVFKRETFTLTGRDGNVYHPLCPRDTGLPAAETVNCHCIMDTVKDSSALGIDDKEWKELRDKYMDEVDAEYEAWEEKFKKDYGIENPRDDPSITWEVYNSYYEAYKKGEL